MPDEKVILPDAIEMGIANFEATRGSVPDSFKLLLEHAPAAFAGYGMIRSDLMKNGALDLKTKELIFALRRPRPQYDFQHRLRSHRLRSLPTSCDVAPRNTTRMGC